MMGIEGLQGIIGEITEDVKQFISEKPLATAGIGAGVIGATAFGVAVAKRKKKTRAKKKKLVKKKKTKRGRARDRMFRSKQKHELAYVRRKKRAGKKITRPTYKTRKRVGKIYHTKKGQPYKIMASGKARFIKKSKGGKR